MSDLNNEMQASDLEFNSHQQDKKVKLFPVRLRNRVMSAGLESVPSNTEKSCIASYYRQFEKL